MDILEIGWGGDDWIGLAQDRHKWRALVNAVMNLHVPLNAGKLSIGYTSGDLSSSAQLHRVVLEFISVRVFDTALFCLDHLSSVKMASLQFYLQSWEQKNRMDGDDSYAFLGKNCRVKKVA
jgi:hypothetical protein